MKKSLSFAFALGCAAMSQLSAQVVQVAGPVAGANVVNFNALALGAAGIGAFGGFGVSVTSGCFVANAFVNAGFGAGNPVQAANLLPNSDPCAGVGQPLGALRLTFTTPQNYFGLFGVSNQVQTGPQTSVPGTITLTTATGSVSVTTNDFFNFGSNGGAKFVGFTDATGFTSVTIAANANGAFGIDDVSFKSNALVTPEPASLLLVAGGLMAVAAVARRKRAA